MSCRCLRASAVAKALLYAVAVVKADRVQDESCMKGEE